MSSLLLSFLSRFTQRAAAAPLAPTSWAIVCMWRRFFALQDEADEQHLALVAEALEALQAEAAPVAAPAAARLRRDLAADYYRDLRAAALGARVAPVAEEPLSPLQAAVRRLQTEQAERLARNRPDLGVPREDGDYMYYAQ